MRRYGKFWVHPAHIGLFFVCLIAIALGYFTARANGATTDTPPPAWTLLKQELGKDPNKADIVDLGKALRSALAARVDLLLPLAQTASSLACRMPYKRAALLVVVQICVDARPDRLVEIVDTCYAICPDGVRGVEEKLVIAVPEEGDLTPKWVPPEFPTTNIWSAVTPVTNR